MIKEITKLLEQKKNKVCYSRMILRQVLGLCAANEQAPTLMQVEHGSVVCYDIN
jgi:hypothetical protein